MPKFVNTQTGQTVELVGPAIDLARKSGQFEPADGGGWDTTLAGAPVRLPATATEFQSGTAGPAPGAEAQLAGERAAFLEDMHGGAANQALAFGEGLASGVTFGGSDVALNALGAETKQRAEQNKKSRIAGEFTGIVGTSIVGAGVGSGTRLGQLIAKTPTGQLAKASTAMAERIGGVKGLATAAAVENATYALGQTTSKLLITDEPLSAEAVVASLAKNAAIGAAGGAVGGLIGGGLRAGIGKLKERVTVGAPIVDMSTEEGKLIASSVADAVTAIDDTATRAIDDFGGAKLDDVIFPSPADVTKGLKGRMPKGAGVKQDLPEFGPEFPRFADQFELPPRVTAPDDLGATALTADDIAGIAQPAKPPKAEVTFAPEPVNAKTGQRVPNHERAAWGSEKKPRPVGEIEVNGRALSIDSQARVHKGAGGHTTLSIRARDPEGGFVGRADFDMVDNELVPLGVKVSPAFQRQGLATRLYESAEHVTGLRAVQVEASTEAGEAFTAAYGRRGLRPIEAPDPALVAALEGRFKGAAKYTPRDVTALRPGQVGVAKNYVAGLREGAEAVPGRGGIPSAAAATESGALDALAAQRTAQADNLSSLIDNARAQRKALAYAGIPDYAVRGEVAALNRARQNALDALGLEGGMSSNRVLAMLKEAPETAKVKLEALDAYFDEVRKFATARGDEVALQQLKVINDAMTDALTAATGATAPGIWGNAAVGMGLSAAGEAIDGPVGTLMQLVGAAQLVRTGVGAAKAGRGFMGRVAKSAGRVMAGKLTAKVVGANGLAGRTVAYQAGAKAFTSLFDLVSAQKAVAVTTSGTVGRIAASLKKGVKNTPGLMGHNHVHATGLVHDSRFNYGMSEPAPKRDNLQDAYKDRSRELAAVAASPMAVQQAVHDQLAEVRAVSPHLADEMEMLAVAIPKFLYDKMPKDPGTLTRMGRSTWKPLDYEIRQWAQYVKGAMAPVDVLEEAMSGGRVTPQAAEAVRTLYPNLFAQAQQALVDNLDELQSRLALPERVRLSVLFDVPLDSTMSPEFRGFIAEQNALRAEQSQQAAAGRTPGGGPPKPAPMTGAQQLIKA